VKATPLNVVAAILVAVLLIVGPYCVGRWQGYGSGRADCEAKVQAAVDKQKAEDAVSVANLTKQLNSLDAENDAADVAIAGYQAELAKRPDRACVLSPDDAAAVNK
jgi:hypothetical protein